MNIVPSTPDHRPSWCTERHTAGGIVHTTDVGEEIEFTSSLSLALGLFKIDDGPTEIQLITHTDADTSVLGMSLEHALWLRDLLSSACALVLQDEALS